MKKIVRPYLKWGLGINPFRSYEITEDRLTVRNMFSGNKAIALPPKGECSVDQNFLMKIIDSGDVTVKGSGSSVVCTNVGSVQSFISALYNLEANNKAEPKTRPSSLKHIGQDDLGDDVIIIPKMPSSFSALIWELHPLKSFGRPDVEIYELLESGDCLYRDSNKV